MGGWGGKGREGMGKERRGREGREGNGSMHPLGFSKVGAYAFGLVPCGRLVNITRQRTRRTLLPFHRPVINNKYDWFMLINACLPKFLQLSIIIIILVVLSTPLSSQPDYTTDCGIVGL